MDFLDQFIVAVTGTLLTSEIMGLIKQTKLVDAPKRQFLTGADFLRVLEKSPVMGEPRAQRAVYPSWLYETPLADIVTAYFFPGKFEMDYKYEMYSDHGKACEAVIQRRLFEAGVLDCPYRQFQETTVYCPKTGISGRADGILLLEKFKAVGAIRECEMPPPPYTKAILEIKETNNFTYSNIKSVDDIPMKFKWAQCAYQNILGIPQTCFLYIDRDSMAPKPMFFQSPPEMWADICEKCRQFWDYVARQVIPTPEGEISVWEFTNAKPN